MKKEEKLAKLSSITLCAVPTVITYDMGFEYEVLTGTGKATGFGDMGQWPCFKFDCKPDALKLINKIKNGENVSDEEIWKLEITKVLSMYHNPFFGSDGPSETIDTKFVSEIRKCLADLTMIDEPKVIYAYRDKSPDPSDVVISFLPEDIENEFMECHGYYCEENLYEDMDEEELDECYKRAEEFNWGLFYIEYTPEQD